MITQKGFIGLTFVAIIGAGSLLPHDHDASVAPPQTEASKMISDIGSPAYQRRLALCRKFGDDNSKSRHCAFMTYALDNDEAPVASVAPQPAPKGGPSAPQHMPTPGGLGFY